MTAKKRRPKKPWSRTSPEGPWDDLIIGSGMGGMTAAAFLTKLGRRVLVLEQHYIPGGFTHAFPRGKYVWDVGVHAIGEVTRHSITGRVLDRLTDGRLQWASLGPVYDEFFFPGDFHIGFPDNPAQFRRNLLAAFPEEEEAIDGYLAKVREVVGTMRGYFMSRAAPRKLMPAVQWLMARKAQGFFASTVNEVVHQLTDNPRLRTVLTAQWGYYGAAPSRASFAVQAMVTRHYLHGGYYPVGGSQQIALSLLQTVADAGGWTRILADVQQILVERGRAVGVRLEGGEEIRARRVISAAGILSTVRRLLPEPYCHQPWAEETEQIQPGPAHVCLYLGFQGDIRQAGASGANKWFYDTWSPEEETWNLDQPENLGPAPVLYCSFPSLKDPLHDSGPEQRHTGEVVTFVPWQVFKRWQNTSWKKRGPEYEALKEHIQTSLLEQFFERMPALRPMLDHVELSTPASTQTFCRPVGGSIYGLETTPERFANPWLRPRSPIPGLFFAGSEAAMVGVMGAMMGGVLAVSAAEPMKALRFLRKA